VKARKMYPPHVVEPFARFMDLGEPKDPFSNSDLLESPSQVEGLNDVRAKLAGFFNRPLD
jgi:hypothetical protein